MILLFPSNMYSQLNKMILIMPRQPPIVFCFLYQKTLIHNPPFIHICTFDTIHVISGTPFGHCVLHTTAQYILRAFH